MPELDSPTLTVLTYASVAAAAAVLGVVPHLVLGRLSHTTRGWADALAAGLMLGVAYALLTDGLDGPGTGSVESGVGAGAAGAVLGLALVRLTHLWSGTEELDLESLEELDPAYGYKVVLVHTLHAAYEGVAIGAAMLASLPFGIVMALALAVHNIPEAMVLIAVLRSRGTGLPHAAALGVATNLNQVLLAVAVFAVGSAVPALLPWALGFGVGALLYLVLTELLPQAYRQGGHTGIALVTLVAMGVVVALSPGATG